MTDSPADKKTEAAGASPATPTIPKQRLDEVISQKKELAAQVEAMQKELEQLKKGSQPIDVQEITKTLTEVAMAAAEAQVAPFKAEAEKYKLAATLGLNDERQIEAISGYIKKGLDPEEALTLARQKHKDLFPKEARPFDPRMAGAIPPGGLSAARTPLPAEPEDAKDFKLMQEAAAKRDWTTARQHAMAVFGHRVARLRG